MPLTTVESEINGRVFRIEVAVGAQVDEGEALIILESMKMEIPVEAPAAGRVTDILVAIEAEVAEGQPLVVLET